MIEFDQYVDCPHCQHSNYETFAYDFDEADQGGCNSKLMEFECSNYEGDCGKQYWVRGRLDFNLDADDTYTTNPEEKGQADGT